MARLEVVAGNAVGMSILVEDELLIGRQTDGAGRLAEDEEISRSHARVTLDASGFCAIEDLGSTNGTFVNGLRISGPQTVSEGDTIELGATTLAVRELPQRSRLEAPPAGRQPTVIPGRETSPPPGADDPFDGDPSPEVAPAPAPSTDTSSYSPQLQDADVAEPAPAQSPAGELPPSVSVRVEIDFAAREARIGLDGASETVRLELHGGTWRAVAPPPSG